MLTRIVLNGIGFAKLATEETCELTSSQLNKLSMGEHMRKTLQFIACLLIAAFCFINPAQAAKFPTKPITVYIPYGAGGGADLILRIIAEYTTKNGYSMKVVNKTSGGGALASMDVARSRPDGHTLLFSSTGFIIQPTQNNVGYTYDDFVPIANASHMTLTFSVHKDSNINTFQEFVELSRKNPGKYNYGIPSALSAQRLFMSVLAAKEFPDAKIKAVPFGGGHEANTALLGKKTTAAFGVVSTHKNYVASGDFKLLAVSSKERLEAYPDVPTFAEIYGEEHIWQSFNTFFAPKKTKKNILADLETLFMNALNDKEVIEKIEKLGATVDFEDTATITRTLDNLTITIEEAFEIIQKQ